MHGPIAAIQPGWPVLIVAPSGPARPGVEDLVLPLRERGARMSPLTGVIPGQVTAYGSPGCAVSTSTAPSGCTSSRSPAE
jgi:hypothetical protein